jgi:AraC-like DNA-binding protein
MTLYPIYYKQPPSENTQLPLKLAIHTLPHGFVAHRHDYLEFSYVLEGTGWETINGVRYRKQPGSFTFVLPYQVHEIHTDPGSCLKLYNGEFAMSLLLDAGRDAGLRGLLIGEDPPLASHVQVTQEQGTHFRRLLDELYAEFLGHDLWRIPLVRAKLTEVLVQFDRLRRLMPAVLPLPQEFSRTGVGERALWNVIRYIHLHYQDELTLSGVCAAFHISVSHLSDLFKKHSGQTFLQVLHDVRIRHACGLLVSTDMSMEHLALEVGYGSYKTFSRIFKLRKGVTPSDYRKSQTDQGAALVGMT